MKKLSEASRKIDGILKFVFWLFIVATVIGVVALGVLALAPLSMEDMNGWTLKLGNVSLALADSASANINLLKVDAGATMIVLIASAAVLCYGITILRKILACMIKEQPFDGTVSVNIKKLGELIAVASVALNVITAMGDVLLYKVGNLAEVLKSDAIASVAVDVTMVDAKMLFLGVLVILLSYVFKYGEELQQQADETL